VRVRATLRVLAVASEAVPLVKTGGLADVVGALPGALAPHGVQVTTLLPGYLAVMAALGAARTARALPDLFGGPARLVRGPAAGLDIIAIDAPHLFARPGNPYQTADGNPWGDNALRFAALGATASLVATEGLRGQKFDLVHAHDWQGGLACAYLRFAARQVPSVFTIHNMAFQGQFPASIFPRLGLPEVAFATAGLEYFGGVGFLKAGLWFADRITTVSPTYAAEIRTPAAGMGLDGLLRGRADVLHGILNGLDTDAWNPATDPHLAARFDASNAAPRAANKQAVQAALGLAPDALAPLFGFVGRLTWQKGIDLILEALPALFAAGAQLVLLGNGDAELEHRVRGAAAANPGRIGALVGFDEALARRIYAGADVVLVPSRFEPCGLAQLCALRYGAVPVVARVGGLADTVIDANEMARAVGAGTGINFAPPVPELLGAAMLRATSLYREGAPWQRIQANALATDVSWQRSAAQYAALFRETIAAHG
jgi:starch synthase